VSAYRRGYYD